MLEGVDMSRNDVELIAGCRRVAAQTANRPKRHNQPSAIAGGRNTTKQRLLKMQSKRVALMWLAVKKQCWWTARRMERSKCTCLSTRPPPNSLLCVALLVCIERLRRILETSRQPCSRLGQVRNASNRFACPAISGCQTKLLFFSPPSSPRF